LNKKIQLISESPDSALSARQKIGEHFDLLAKTDLSFQEDDANHDIEIVIIVEQTNPQFTDSRITDILPKCKEQDIPLVVFGAEVTPERKIAWLQIGIADFFGPDMPPEELFVRLNRLIDARRARAEAAQLKNQLTRLSQYFSEDVVKMILSQDKLHHDYGENLEATIFFLDIRNFTTISENVEPNLIAKLLNRLYTDIMDLILSYKGSVNKIIGDALLATFGCPVRGSQDALHAVQCALAIRDTLKFFNSTKPEYIQHDISIGMGIATGNVFAGTIGSYRKMDYTVIGDTVNIAARLEGLTKQTKFDLIIDRKTRDLVGEPLQVRKLRVNRVRGRTQPMEIFLVDGIRDDRPADQSGTFFFPRQQ
jgi:class 3 adenylate cyclase